MKKRYGFTLVELLAVIAILAILVLIALPNVIGMFNESKKSTFTIEVKNIAKIASSEWMMDNITNQGVNVYARIDEYDFNHPINIDSRKNLDYYVEFNDSGEIIKLYVTDKVHQYIYEGSGIKATEVSDDHTESVSEIEKNKVIKLINEDNKPKVILNSNEDSQISISIILNEGETKEIENDLYYSSSNTNVAIVENGKIIAIGEGEASISATSSKYIYKVTVNKVSEPSLTLKSDNITLSPRQTYSISADVYPSNSTLTYSSSNKVVASVSQKGVITAYSNGEAIITINSSNGLEKQIKVNVKLNVIDKIFLPNPIFKVAAVKAPDGNYTSVGQGFTITRDYFVACAIQHSNTPREYATIYIYKRSDKTPVKTITIHNDLGHCNDLSYNPNTNEILVSGKGFKSFSLDKALNGEIDINTIGTLTNSGIDYDSYTNKYHYLRSKSGRMGIITGKDGDTIDNPSGVFYPVVSRGSQGIGSYKGKVLYPYFKSTDIDGNKNVENNSDENYFRNGLDIYRASNGEYLGTYLFVAPIKTKAYSSSYTEIEDIVYSGEGEKFYIFYSLGYVFEVNLPIPN